MADEPKKKRRKRPVEPKEKKVLPESAERRHVSVSFAEAELLEYLLSLYEPEHRLRKHFEQVMSDFSNNLLRIHEIEAREKANAWWEEPQEWIDGQLRAAREARRIKMEKHIACLAAREMRRKLKQQAKEKARQERKERLEQARLAAVVPSAPEVAADPSQAPPALVEPPRPEGPEASAGEAPAT